MHALERRDKDLHVCDEGNAKSP